MKKNRLLLLVVGLVSLMIAGQLHADKDKHTVRRVRIQTIDPSTTDFPGDTLLVAADGIEGVGGAGTDITEKMEGNYCDIHFNKITIDEDGNTAVLIGKVVEAPDPNNFGAFVKITAKTNGTANFVFQTLSGVGSTGPGGLDTIGTVKIETLM